MLSAFGQIIPHPSLPHRGPLLAWLVTSEDRLAAIFCAAMPESQASRLESGLGSAIKDAFVRGCAAFSTLRVDEESFTRHLAHALARRSDSATLVKLAIEDLYLVCACMTDVPGAAKLLVSRHEPGIKRTVERVVGKGNGEEIIQQILSDLLLGSDGSPPELTQYAGRAPLVRWLDVVAQRAAQRWQVTERLHARIAGLAAVEPSPSGQTPIDTALFREQYGSDFQRALQEALKRVPKENRAILRLHLVNNVSVEKIGKMLGVSQPTASRRLARARECVLRDMTRVLKERLKISSREIQSLAGLLGDRLDFSIARLLKTAEAQD
jgi:RNA polymerase sigma-70 factor, ECF subfamily